MTVSVIPEWLQPLLQALLELSLQKQQTQPNFLGHKDSYVCSRKKKEPTHIEHLLCLALSEMWVHAKYFILIILFNNHKPFTWKLPFVYLFNSQES